jgi:hypothetical protein
MCMRARFLAKHSKLKMDRAIVLWSRAYTYKNKCGCVVYVNAREYTSGAGDPSSPFDNNVACLNLNRTVNNNTCMMHTNPMHIPSERPTHKCNTKENPHVHKDEAYVHHGARTVTQHSDAHVKMPRHLSTRPCTRAKTRHTYNTHG